jgi:SAM-dependent methyltransferase
MSQPFDAVAATYDRDFTDRRLGMWLRDLVWEHIPFQAGDHILELGCGTGEDALRLARRGVQVIATDVSAVMLAKAKQKVKSAGLSGQVTFQQLDLNRPDQLADESMGAFDGVLANFGALNCVADRRALADYLAQRVRAGGQSILVVMGPLCPWEILWHLLHLKPAQAFRRWKAGEMAHVGDGEKIPVWYPSPRRLQSDFISHFRHCKTIGIGTLLPPSYLAHLVDRWPGAFARFATVDRLWGGHLPMTWLNDHYMLVMERV